MTIATTQLQNIVKAVQNKFLQVFAVYLFGSMVKGNAIAESDVDIAVLAEKPLPAMALWLLAQDLAKEVNRDVDLVDLQTASAVLRIQIIANGERLFCRDEKAATLFEDFVFADYARLNEERADILRDIQQRGSIYG